MSNITPEGGAWGASPDEWVHFADGLGLMVDLLPVVSNPKAEISADSKIKQLGKTPSRYNNDGKVVGFPQWTQHVTTERDIARWVKHSDCGISLQTRRVRALDIDIDDPHEAAKVAGLIELALGDLPRRMRNNSGKMLLAFDMVGDFAKRIIRTEHGIIEFLATGQQFIAVGTHTSGARYEWAGGLPEEIPIVTPAEFEQVWAALVDAFALPDGEQRSRNGMVPTVVRRRDDVNDPVVGFLQDAGMVREWSRDGRVHITCPWEHEHTGDSGPSATSWFPAGVGGFQQGHFKCLHAHCASRTDGDFFEAINYVSSDFDVVVAEPGQPEPEPWPVFTRDKHGSIESGADNATKAIARPDIVRYRVAYDEFKDALMIAPENGGSWKPFADTDYTRLRIELERRGFKSPGSELVRDAVKLVGNNNRFDSAQDWANSLVWDGIERVEMFLATHYRAEDTNYARAVSLYMWTALAGRCLQPGAQADMSPIFVSGQGTGKTRGIRAMAPEEGSFVEVNLEHRDDNVARSLRGKLVGELAELRGLMTRDAESIKAWMTRTHEEWIPKYQEFAVRFARRLLFIGTTNEDEFLADATGERRWLPIRVGESDIEMIERDRDQLWAEAISLFKRGGIIWRDAQALAVEHHAEFKVQDSWEEPIRRWLETDEMDSEDGEPRKMRPFKLHEMLSSALSLDPKNVSRREELRAGRVLRTLGLRRGSARLEGHVQKCWYFAIETT